MLSSVPVQQPRNLEQYRGIANDDVLDEVHYLGEKLAGVRVAHINSTAHGGGVAEILYTLVPLMQDAGLDAHWHLMDGDQDFFTITKLFHNALQGMELIFTDEMRDKYMSVCEENAADFDEEYDLVVVHDPQPCAMLAAVEENNGRKGKWVWRCHIDSTFAKDNAWEFFEPFINRFDGAIFTKDDYIKTPLEVPCLAFIPPSIDPLSPKNIIPEKRVQSDIARRYGVDETHPIMLQVSRFDPWKDPLGLVDCYREVKKDYRDVQLVYLASMADDDPEGWHYYEKTFNYSDGDPDIFLLSNQQGVGNVEVSAFQAMSTVVLQKSLREGFGLTVSEAMWKHKPVVAGEVGGILLQVQDGVNGFLIDDIDEAAEKVKLLLESPAAAQRMGEAGHDKVRRNFLITRQLLDYLRFFDLILNHD